MKNKFFYIFGMSLLFLTALTTNLCADEKGLEKHLTIIIPSYNNAQWYEKNLRSVFMQKYSNYSVIYCNDCSTDDTFNKVQKYICSVGMEDKVTLISNPVRRGKAANLWLTLHNRNSEYIISDESIVVVLDGDDWYPHDGIFSYINKLYTENDIWFSYGGFQEYPSQKKCFNKPIPQKILDTNSFRKAGAFGSQQRTFYAWLYRQIKLEDCICEGYFIPVVSDIAKVIPMLEMCSPRFKLVDDYIYVYNRLNTINDDKIDHKLQWKIDHYFRLKPAYPKLHEPKFLSLDSYAPIDCIVSVQEHQLNKIDPQSLYSQLEQQFSDIGRVIVLADQKSRYLVVEHDGSNHFKTTRGVGLNSLLKGVSSKYVCFLNLEKLACFNSTNLSEVNHSLEKTHAFCYEIFPAKQKHYEQLGSGLCGYQTSCSLSYIKKRGGFDGMVYKTEELVSFLGGLEEKTFSFFKKKWDEYCCSRQNRHKICLLHKN
ncbi:glycosyltransferase [bacterium]|nr:glycosyltransferase [bacterium]MBT5015705.1 glycosyltransferase [bacterium]